MVQKPNIVKGIPTLLVRAMPTIFYYGRYADQKISDRAKSCLDSYLNYLIQGIKIMASVMNDNELAAVVGKVANLSQIKPAQIEDELFQISRNLSVIFLSKKDLVKEKYDGANGAKDSLTKLFHSTVKSPKIAIVDTNNELEWVDKLSATLSESCYYDTIKTRPIAENYTDDILQSDFVLFASATPQRIHEDVEALKNYKKPGLILGQLKKDEKSDQQTIRNGSWLRSRGYDVLFKLFSPLRLFTTIDKINIRFLLQD
jgi:hypothetical protein